ncbi:family 78 glycoside hydrolase catalytic domain [Luteimicrobium album]|uniref:family 78 glycoside hydrolase catalytic domain n=1 Tax=Luteimicrobium album TaxID=1054550 RepID=UPI0024E055D2|nr:family 78 glycoside hydrolase catalytic domain [Luteimicrobium album]
MTGLTVNGRVDPLGIADDPAFGWTTRSAARGVTQSAYQIRVLDGDGKKVWDSGRVTSDAQTSIAYGGSKLASQTRYTWQAKIWDGAGQESDWSEAASFETGMLSPDDWSAQWITNGGDAAAAGWADYTVTTKLHIDKVAAGVYFRSQDASNGYMWQLTTVTGAAHLRMHVKVNGSFTVLEDKDISSVVSAKDLLAGEHTLTITTSGSTITTLLDGKEVDTRTDTTFASGYVGLRSSAGESATVQSVSVESAAGKSLLSTDFGAGVNPFTGGTVSGSTLVVADGQEATYTKPLPLLRDTFATDQGKTVKSARLYASALGVYQLSIDGKAVGDQHLAPGETEYDSRIQSQTYDVTDLIASGENAIGAAIGSGWYSGKNAWLSPDFWGSTNALIAQLRIDYTDGTSQVVETDPSWAWHDGPFDVADNLDGETYDAAAAQDGYDTASFDASGWNAASTIPNSDKETALLVPQPDEPVRTTDVLGAQSVAEHPAGAYIYDMGQNAVGVGQFTITGHKGQTVTFRYGEVLNPDGTLYTTNLRSAKATDHYTFAEDGTVTYTPTFTFHGFRYIEITGLSSAPALSDVKTEVWGSDLAQSGSLTTSNAQLNQLLSNISWGQRGNFLSVPTDTPARDERLGWLGDINVFSPTAADLRDTRAFMKKFTADMRDTQYDDGHLDGVAPNFNGVASGAGGIAWEDAMVTVPYSVFDAYGDTSIVEENYDAMKKFMGHVESSAGADLIDSDRGVYGDWLSLGGSTPNGVLGTAYFAQDAEMMSKMAAAIGKTDDAATYADLAERVRAAFAKAYVAADGTVGNGTQTGYAMALGMNLVPAAQIEAVGAKFVAKIHEDGDHLTTGFVGTPWLLPALTAVGRNDVAYQLLGNKTYPSWLYEVENGATTMWERWDSIRADGSFEDPAMNSFNHYAYGAVGDWMYKTIGGVTSTSAGYKTMTIQPVPGGGLTHAAETYQSAYGEISTDWSTTDGEFDLAVTVPVNTTAKVVLDADNQWAVTEGGSSLDKADGVTDVKASGGTVTISIGSGTYHFAVQDDLATIGKALDAIDRAATDVSTDLASGDLAQEEGDHLQGVLADARSDVSDALAEAVAGKTADEIASLQSALDAVTGLRTWLTSAAVDGPVRGSIDAALSDVETKLQTATTQALGVKVALMPIDESVVAGGSAVCQLQLVNDGEKAVTAISGKVDVKGLGSAAITADDVAGGATATVPVTIPVLSGVDPGSFDATFTTTFTVDGHTYTLTGRTSDFATVTSGVAIGDGSLDVATTVPVESGSITVPLTNGSDHAVRLQVAAQLPDGWSSVPSTTVVLAAGATEKVTVPVALPEEHSDHEVDVTLQVRRSGAVLATSKQTLSYMLPTPPSDSTDHVDFGESGSEQAHDVKASPQSSTSVEAGLTRRYSFSTVGQYFSAAVDVPKDQPYVLRMISTFDHAITKRFDVNVNGVDLGEIDVKNTGANGGTVTTDLLVDDAGALSSDGNVRVTFTYPEDATGYGDPSIADLWVVPAGADTTAPAVGAEVVSGSGGTDGWYSSDVSVAVSAADTRDAAPSLQYGLTDGWKDYTGPVALSGEGDHTLSYRATDASGNRATGTIGVKIDETAPETTLSVSTGSGNEHSDQASLKLTATDALSGVASTTYRVDGGAWEKAGTDAIEVDGFGEHVVEYASTDLAGNVETLRSTTVTLSDVDTLQSVVAPQVSGTAKVGARLTASTGTWNTKGVATKIQWLRDGTPITGATGTTHVLAAADLGKRLSVAVTGSKSGFDTVTVTSASTSKIAKATSSTVVRANHASVKAGASVTVSAQVTAVGLTPSGKVAIKVDGKTVKTVSLSRGQVSTSVKLATTGTHKVSAAYAGSGTIAGSTSRAVAVKVTKATSATTLKVNHASVRSGGKVTATVRVTASGSTPSGKVAIKVDGKTIKTVALSHGKASVSVKLSGKGTHKVTATYAGSSTVAGSTSHKVSVRVTKK